MKKRVPKTPARAPRPLAPTDLGRVIGGHIGGIGYQQSDLDLVPPSNSSNG